MTTVVNKLTGEVYELQDETPEQLKDSWQLLSETIKALERAKDKLKPKVSELLNDNGQYDFGDVMFRRVTVQRETYDKAIMRENLDPDLFDTLLVPDKTAIDNYLKEHLEELGEVSTTLRLTMIPVGQPYSILRLEKVKRDEPMV